MNDIEHIKNLRECKELFSRFSVYDYDEKEVKRFVDTINKAIKVCEKYYSKKRGG